jgi:hypothetical protein
MEIIFITPQLWQTSEISDLTKALVLFQSKLCKISIIKDAKNPSLKNKYLSLDHIINLTKPILSECKLVIVQDMAGGFLTTQLMHESGQFKGSAMEFNPMAGNRGTNKLQEIGGGITYAKRYTWAALLGISADTDDDANGMKGKDVQPKVIIKQEIKDATHAQKLIDHAVKEGKTHQDIALHFVCSEEQLKKLKLGIAKKTLENATTKD